MLDLLKTALWGAAALLCSQAFAQGQRLSAEQYITQWKDVAVRKMKEHGIPASITLAQGLLESGNGNSKLAREGNNHFGIKCTPDWTGGKTYHDDDAKGECFRKYRNAEQSYEDHAKFLKRPRYASLFELKPTDYKGWAHGLKKAGYATDPNYAPKLISLIDRYELHKLDRGVDISPRPASKPAQQKPAAKGSGQGGQVVTIGGGRTVELSEGSRVKFVRAREGEDLRRLAREMEMTHGMLARWNDMDKDANLAAGQRVYIQPKRNMLRSPDTHTARDGESLWSVSQQYGVKLAKLAKYNELQPDARLTEGQSILLRKPRR